MKIFSLVYAKKPHFSLRIKKFSRLGGYLTLLKSPRKAPKKPFLNPIFPKLATIVRNIQQMNLQMQHMQNMMQNFAAKQAENSKAAVQKK